MDTKFQTSFIPKKTILLEQKSVKHSGGTSIFMFISILIFIVSLGGGAFTYFWKDVLLKDQENYRLDLKKAESRFDIALIEKLKKANIKIDLGNKLFREHLAVSEIFSIISLLTIEGVRFTSFEFSSPSLPGDGLKIIMKGVGSDFSSIAYQSDVFGQSGKFGKNKVLKNPVLTDLVLIPNGDVGFTFTATLNPADVSYEKVLTGDTTEAATPVPESTSTQATP